MQAPADSTWRGYSLTERDRRWQAVRDNAGRAGFDCTFVPLGARPDSRYLTEMANAVVVLPTDGRPPIVINDRGRPNIWVPEPRSAAGGMRGTWVPATVQALNDAGMERARIGVVGLKGGKVTHVRAPDGVVNYSSYADVARLLPNATFEDATDVVGFARYIKSDEEIDCMGRAAAIAEAGIDELIEAARPGADAAVVYTRAMARMMELGSEHYPLAVHIGPIGQETPRYTDPPIGIRLQPGDYITNETSAVWGGQLSQEDQPIVIGPIPDEWRPVIELQRELFEAGRAFMKPGTAFADLIDFVNGFGAKRGMKTLILMHGRGVGDDNGPLLTPRSTGEDIRDVRVERNNVWVFKPYAMSADERLSFVWGGDVVVTDQGGHPLFRRSHGMVSVT